MSNELPKDYFNILGISSSDLQGPDPVKAVRKAYRNLARENRIVTGISRNFY